MFTTVLNALKVKEIRAKIFYTLFILAIVRFGVHITIPGVDTSGFSEAINNNGILSILNSFSGNALKQLSIFALSVSPYISASIIMTLLTSAFDTLKEKAKDDSGFVATWTRYITVILAVIQSIAIVITLKTGALGTTYSDPGMKNYITTVIVLTAGTMLLMWLGERINEKGIGNGISLIIFINIIATLPSFVANIVNSVKDADGKSVPIAIIIFGTYILMLIGIVITYRAERKVPVQYAKRQVGRKQYAGQSSHIPIKLNQAGVIPIIFAQSIIILPGTLIAFFGSTELRTGFDKWFGSTSVIYLLVFTLLIMLFTFFYSVVSFNPVDVAKNLKDNGGFIPGIRPGKWTAETLQKILTRITLFGGLFLAILAIFPNLLEIFVKAFGKVPLQIGLGGTSLIIAVGVTLETIKQLESQLLMRNYEGFLKK